MTNDVKQKESQPMDGCYINASEIKSHLIINGFSIKDLFISCLKGYEDKILDDKAIEELATMIEEEFAIKLRLVQG